ncbi:hypothetical protein [Telluria beijingensis]|uniref:hypothetical protein n=1 Tax=Telluria beijingensis TaxID=3068633 RepID=UPI00279535FE|nr:hypothetical protein [Massilia sp. REN29]
MNRRQRTAPTVLTVLLAAAYMAATAQAAETRCNGTIVSEGPNRGACTGQWIAAKQAPAEPYGWRLARHIHANREGLQQCQTVFSLLKGMGGFGGLQAGKQAQAKTIKERMQEIGEAMRRDPRAFDEAMRGYGGQAMEFASVVRKFDNPRAFASHLNGGTTQSQAFLEDFDFDNLDQHVGRAQQALPATVSQSQAVSAYLASTAPVACLDAAGKLIAEMRY